RELLAAYALLAAVRELARTALGLHDAPGLACGRCLVEAEDFDGRPGCGLGELLAAEVVQRTHARPRVAGDDRVADAQRATVDEHRRDGSAALVETGLDDRTGRLDAGIRL